MRGLHRRAASREPQHGHERVTNVLVEHTPMLRDHFHHGGEIIVEHGNGFLGAISAEIWVKARMSENKTLAFCIFPPKESVSSASTLSVTSLGR